MTADHTKTTQAAETWHVVQQADGHCKINSQTELDQVTDTPKTWGPFTSRTEAIAKRVGLIRANKCLPSR
ncbi:MAG: hypothetical protein KTR27_02060 [Leptolyngbyaceae cyanobacterium MAG.088]|nr:hypothetical protein [Leptolyngbyaceae cyanobacterium MAG.088]